jgi:hypothetical protein
LIMLPRNYSQAWLMSKVRISKSQRDLHGFFNSTISREK